MQVICSWCENFMREKEPFNDGSTSHGICRRCYRKVTDEIQSSIRGYKKEKKGISKHKNRRDKTEGGGEPLSLTGGGVQRLSQAEGGISFLVHTQDNPMDDEGEIEAGFENGEKQRVEDKNRGRNRHEEFRSLNVYIKEVAREPLLSPEEEIEISAEIKECEARARRIRCLILKLSNEKAGAGKGRLHQGGKGKEPLERIVKLNTLMDNYLDRAQKLKQQFAKSNLRFVIKIANGFRGRGLPLLDLIQEGNIGLMKAVERFDHTKGNRFSTYASWWIYWTISRAVLTQTATVKIPAYVAEKSTLLRKTVGSLYMEIKRKPTAEEIGRRSGIPVRTVERILEIVNDPSPLDLAIAGKQNPFDDIIADGKFASPDSLTSKTELLKKLGEALSLLTSREEKIIKMRYGIEYETVHTLEEVGSEFNLTRERVRQLEKRALKKIATSKMKKILREFL